MFRVFLIAGALAAVVQSRSAAAEFIGAPEPGELHTAGPLSPEEERQLFTLPPGFEIELVASESEGIGKFVTVAWDIEGRMWSMTALEYPVDANESPEQAAALYASIARDKVLVWDEPFGPGPHTPRVFAEGLAIPLGLLPYRDGVYVQHGSDIAYLEDTDGDGKADRRETILTGFGVQDSHLFPHQFTRAPGNWIWMAQGAFNYGKVKTSSGEEIQFDQTRMAKFRYDGSEFEITSQGPCNIWGLVINQEGEAFIQEANDYGYPMMPFHEHANYPGCSNGQFKSYAPEFPGTAPDFRMGGTGLSGLALSDAEGAWPAPYAGIFYIANPITRKIQAIRAHRDGPRYRLEKLPDFIQSADEMFRPVSIHFGPDGCLYIVDWYNKIISHNEVPRTHPERDKKRGRIWRVRHKEQRPFTVPDFTQLAPEALLEKLGGPSLAQHHLAWQAIGDRNLTGLAPELAAILTSASEPAARRIGALWALEALDRLELTALEPALGDPNRNLRREAIRALANTGAGAAQITALLEPLANDPDPEVRAQIIRTLGPILGPVPETAEVIIRLARPSLDQPTGRSTHNGSEIKIGEAYEREFERYLARLYLEAAPDAAAAFLDSPAAAGLPIENRMVAALALEPRQSAARVARLLPDLDRAPNEEELLRLARFPGEPGVAAALREALTHAEGAFDALEALLRSRTRFDAEPLLPLIGGAAHNLWKGNPAARDLALRLVSGFKISEMAAELADALRSDDAPLETRIAILRALREMGGGEPALFARLARHSERPLRDEALAALAAADHSDAPRLLLELWPGLNHLERSAALDRLAATPAGAAALSASLESGVLTPRDLKAAHWRKLTTLRPDDPVLTAMVREMEEFSRPLLRLDGTDAAWLPAGIQLEGPFTVETWVKLDAGISNNDGILGAPGVLDLNFHDGRFRAWVGGMNDVLIASKKIVPGNWTHLALTRDAEGRLRIYFNGELDAGPSEPAARDFDGLRVGWTAPAEGTQGWLAEFRVWEHAHGAGEIRAHFDRAFDPSEKIPGLARNFTGRNWPGPKSAARIELSRDFPPVLTAAQAREQSAKLARFRGLAEKGGNAAAGRALFELSCLTCHTVGGQGGQIGPVLDGAAAGGMDGLLRALLTPNAAMEGGYRTFRVELKDGNLVDGMLVSQDAEAIILRQPNAEDRRIPHDEVVRAGYLKTSLMPEGLLESLSREDAANLLAYLKTLR